IFAFEEAEIIAEVKAEPFWFWKFLGRLHPLAVHFPVSVIVVAAFMELFTLKNFNSSLRTGINVLILVGAISAVLSVFFGWLLADLESYGGETLDLHQWIGIATAVLSLLTLILIYFIKKNNKKTFIIIYRSL